MYGLVATVSLMIGAGLGLVRRWSPRLVGIVLGLGAGALVSSVFLELAEEGLRVGGATSVAVGLAAGAVTFFVADLAVERIGGRDGGQGSGLPLALLLEVSQMSVSTPVSPTVASAPPARPELEPVTFTCVLA